MTLIEAREVLKANHSTSMKAIMSTAWQLARYAAAQFGGKASQYISGCLKDAWKNYRELIRNAVATILDATTDFSRWTRYGMDRCYIDAADLGYSGKAKTYYDVKSGKVYSDRTDLKAAAEKIIAAAI